MRGVRVPLEHLFLHLLSLGPPVVGRNHPSELACLSLAVCLLELSAKLPSQLETGMWLSPQSTGTPTGSSDSHLSLLSTARRESQRLGKGARPRTLAGGPLDV